MRFSRYYFKYEMKMLLSNFVSLFFTFVFPILITCLIGYAVSQMDAPDVIRREIVSRIFIGNITMLPLSLCLISYATFYSVEIEYHITQRLELFGINQIDIFRHRFLVYFLYLAFSTMVYVVTVNLFLGVHQSTFGKYVVLFCCYLAFGITLLMISHGIAVLLGKMSKTYAVSMILYFGILVTGGNMGIQYNQFPKLLQSIARINVVTYFSANLKGSIVDYWLGKGNQIYPTVYILFGWFLVALLFLYLVTEYRKKNPLY